MADDATPTQTSETTASPASEAAVGAPPVVDVAAAAVAPVPGAESPVAAEATALGNAGEKPAEEAKPGAPDAYELTMPEGLILDKGALDAATPVFRDMGLSNEQAQKLMPVAADFAKKIQDGLNQQIIGQVAADRKAWLDTAKADPEIGGAHWDGTITAAAKGLDGLGFVKGTPFRNLLDESGLGNHPEMIRAWSKVGKAIGEDSDFVRAGVIAPEPPKTLAEALYGKNRT